jgi:hypothetical protein
VERTESHGPGPVGRQTMGIQGLGADQLLNAFRDIAYVVDANGMIVAYSRRSWDRFARENDTAELADPSRVMGVPIQEAIDGTETRETYRQFSELLWNGKQEAVCFEYRCDAPDLRREMRMTMTPILGEGGVRGILYHSVTLAASPRPTIGLFARSAARDGDSGLPLLGVCSYCKDVRFPAGEKEGRWVTPERYYQLGGSESVALSHGVCPACYRSFIEPMLMDLKKGRY